ncbi:hypothetical protein GCM10023116_04700 [Kistimonas scapharcae]|uniref:Uncharacterized protein n=1 Tax=Kistimonas scapharcae TaxID=1036133 RepID=A0ABP8UWT9_9GAMM
MNFQPAWLDDDDFEDDDWGEFDDESLEFYDEVHEVDDGAFEFDEEPALTHPIKASSARVNNEMLLERNRRQTTSTRWQSVPVQMDPRLHRYNNSETTLDHNYIRVGAKKANLLQERKSPQKGSVYKIKIGDYRDNLLRKVANATCPPTSPGHSDQCKGRVELTSCFKTVNDTVLPPALHALKMVSRTFIHDCSQAIPYGSRFAMAMDVDFQLIGPGIFVQLHGLPDHFTYAYPNTTQIYPLPLNVDHSIYQALSMHSAQFEKDGYPPFTLALKQEGGRNYVVAKVRSMYAPYIHKSMRCNSKFDLTTLNQAKCCQRNVQDISYVYAGEVGRDFNSTGWNRLAFELLSSRYNETQPTAGHVRIWVNGNMTTNTNVFLGRNDAPERGGGGMYYKFGIYRTNSEKPITLQFRNVRTGHDIRDVDAGLAVTQPPVNVRDTCYPLSNPSTTIAAPNTTASTTTSSTTTSLMMNTTAIGVTAPNYTASQTSPVTASPVVNINNTTVTIPGNTTTSLLNANRTSLTTDAMTTPQDGRNATHINDCSDDTFKYLFIGSVILNVTLITTFTGLLCVQRRSKAQIPKLSHGSARQTTMIEENETELRFLASTT